MKLYLDFMVKVLTFLLDLFSHKRNVSNIESIVNIYTAMKKVVYEDANDDLENPVYQFLVLKAENGGKTIRPGSQLYLSCLYEDYRSPIGSSMRYQRVHIDGDMMSVLLETMKGTVIRFKTTDLKDTALLRMMCEVECVTFGEVHYLYDKKETIYFTLITTIDNEDLFTKAATRMNIETAISTIRNLIKKAV